MQLLTPRQFCRIYFGLADLPEEVIQQEEKSFGYKTRCAIVLARILGMSKTTLMNIRYSRGIDFEGMNSQGRLILTLWAIQKRYPQKIAQLEQCVRELSSRPRRARAA